MSSGSNACFCSRRWIGTATTPGRKCRPAPTARPLHLRLCGSDLARYQPSPIGWMALYRLSPGTRRASPYYYCVFSFERLGARGMPESGLAGVRILFLEDDAVINLDMVDVL